MFSAPCERLWAVRPGARGRRNWRWRQRRRRDASAARQRDPDDNWSDGQPVTARDFVYSFKRILDPNTAAEYASFFADAGIVGAADFNSGKGNADSVGVRAVDDNTLEIKLENAIGYFPDLVALW